WHDFEDQQQGHEDPITSSQEDSASKRNTTFEDVEIDDDLVAQYQAEKLEPSTRATYETYIAHLNQFRKDQNIEQGNFYSDETYAKFLMAAEMKLGYSKSALRQVKAALNYERVSKRIPKIDDDWS